MEAEIRHAAFAKHNFLILGQAGTGKSHIIRTLSDDLRKSGQNVSITATTGLAASHLHGCTIHKFSGILDGRYDTAQLVDKLMNDPERSLAATKERIMKTDTLICDEISMLSVKMFQQIEAVLRLVRGNNEPFGGIQFIGAGDFLQLKPVPHNLYGDPGQSLASWDQLPTLVPHRFVLTQVFRQSEEDLIIAVQEISQGQASDATVNLLRDLQRPFSPDAPCPMKLFAHVAEAELHNSNCLLEMEGEIRCFESQDEGDIQALSTCQALKELYLKKGAPVILNRNIPHSETLVNGSRGTVVDFDENRVCVSFSKTQSLIWLERITFSIFDPKKNAYIAQRSQIPLRLAFGLTVHKAQGLTLDFVEVDCRNMSMPGQLGVAIGRARCKDGLRVKYFSKKRLTKHPEAVEDFIHNPSIPVLEDCSCCKTTVHWHIPAPPPSPSFSTDSDNLSEDNFDDDLCSIIMDSFDNPSGIGQDEVSAILVKLQKEKYADPETPEQTDFNNAVDDLINNLDRTNAFMSVLQLKLESFYTGDSNKEVVEFQGKIIHFTNRKNREYQRLLFMLFQSAMTPSRASAVGVLVKELRLKILSAAAEPVMEHERRRQSQQGPTFHDSAGGRGKIRYVAGFCIAKLRFHSRQTVGRNLYKDHKKDAVLKASRDVMRLNYLTDTEDNLMKSSEDIESLREIQLKQNLSGSLCNVRDDTYQFFHSLDMGLRQEESDFNLNFHGANLYNDILDKFLDSVQQKSKWKELFNPIENEEDYDDTMADEEELEELYKQVIQKYVTFSSSQFIKEYIMKTRTEKLEAHRKQIKITKGKKESRARAYSLKDIENDKTSMKIASHHRLRSECEQNPRYFISTAFPVRDLKLLCHAYGIHTKANSRKGDMGEVLHSAVSSVESMPYPGVFSKSSVSEDIESGSGCVSVSAHEESSANASTSLPLLKDRGVKRKGRTSGKGKGKGKKTKSSNSTELDCEICCTECFEDSVCCDTCNRWYHYECVKLSEEEKRRVLLTHTTWVCENCPK